MRFTGKRALVTGSSRRRCMRGGRRWAAWITGQTLFVDGGASLIDTVLPLDMQIPAAVGV